MDWQPGFDFRLPNFLELPQAGMGAGRGRGDAQWGRGALLTVCAPLSPQVPAHIRGSRKAAAMLLQKPNAGARLPEGAAALLWPGMAERELEAALQRTEDAAVLELR